MRLGISKSYGSPRARGKSFGSPRATGGFRTRVLGCGPSLLHRTDLRLRRAICSSLQGSHYQRSAPIIAGVVGKVFNLLGMCFSRSRYAYVSRLMLYRLGTFFVNFRRCLRHGPRCHPSRIGSCHMERLFGQFVVLLRESCGVSESIGCCTRRVGVSSGCLAGVIDRIAKRAPGAVVSRCIVLRLGVRLGQAARDVGRVT